MLNKILAEKIKMEKFLSIVQVGACDGVINDPIYNFVMEHKQNNRILLIEPQSSLLTILKKNYSLHPNAQIINCAIGSPGVLSLFRLKRKYHSQLKRTYLHEAADYRVPAGFVSENKHHVMSHIAGKLPENIVLDEAIEEFIVPSNELIDILDKCGWDNIDVLQVDAEGKDDTVLEHCNLESLRPKLINFEHFHLSPVQKKNLYCYLENLGYSVYEYSNTDAIATTYPIPCFIHENFTK